MKIRTKDEIIDSMACEMPFELPFSIRPYIKEAMDIYAKQELSKLHQPTVISAVCDKCLGRGSHVIYDTCIECKKCNGNGTQTDL